VVDRPQSISTTRAYFLDRWPVTGRLRVCRNRLVQWTRRQRLRLHSASGAGQLTRIVSPSMRAQRANLKSRRDDLIIARASAAPPGVTDAKLSPSFSSGLARLPARQTRRKKRLGGWLFNQGGGLSGLALGYYHAAPSGLGKGEPDHYPSDRSRFGRERMRVGNGLCQRRSRTLLTRRAGPDKIVGAICNAGSLRRNVPSKGVSFVESEINWSNWCWLQTM